MPEASMRNRDSLGASLHLKVNNYGLRSQPWPDRALQALPSLPRSSSDMEGNDIQFPLVEKRWPSKKPSWSADVAGLFILLCSFLLATISIVFVALVFHRQVKSQFTPLPENLSILQRIISSLSVTITSAVITV